MRLTVRGKLFAASFGGVVVAIIAGGIYLERQLRAALEQSIEQTLEHHARTVSAAIAMRPELVRTIPSADALADRFGRTTGARVTLIAADGRVLGDSELSAQQVRSVENHGRRPEVIEAASSGRGFWRRYSTTLQSDMLYLAVPVGTTGAPNSARSADGRPAMVIRVAMPLHSVDSAVAHLRAMLALAGVLGLTAAALLSLFASQLMSRALRQLVSRVRLQLEDGERSGDRPAATDEIAHLAGSFSRLAGELDRTVSALADERSRFAAVLETMSDAVLVTDGATRITLINPAALELLRADRDCIGRPLIETVRVPALDDLVQRGQRDPVVVDLTLPVRDEINAAGEVTVGARRQVTARATPLPTGGTLVVLQDMTEMRRLETVRRDFIANVSHELRTPVSVIAANAETLLDGALDDPDSARRFVTGLQRNAQRLSRIIADLLDLSRIEAGRLEVEIEPLALGEVARRSIDGLAAAADDKRLSVRSEVDDDLRVRADAGAVEQVLVNLIDNAIKYTPAGGHVTVSAHRTGDLVRVEVADDGPGIEPHHRARLFERFYRVDPGRSRQMGGTGLGLSIVKHLVETMEGEVGVSGVSPHGALLWFTLPSARS